MENHILVAFWKQGLLLFSWTYRVKLELCFSMDGHSRTPELLSEIKGAVRRCGRLILNQIHLTLHPDVFNVMIKMKSYLWERDSLNLNERFQRSGNTIPIWMLSFIVRKDETNLCGFNFEAHWRRKRRGPEGQVHECVWSIVTRLPRDDWNLQSVSKLPLLNV